MDGHRDRQTFLGKYYFRWDDRFSDGIVLGIATGDCSKDEVKVKLFKSYCTTFYGCTLWTKYTSACKNKLVVAYKQIFRNLMNVQREGTTMNMLKFNVDHLDVVLRKLLFGFRNRLLLCDNSIVQAIMCSLQFYSSSLFKTWDKILPPDNVIF